MNSDVDLLSRPDTGGTVDHVARRGKSALLAVVVMRPCDADCSNSCGFDCHVCCAGVPRDYWNYCRMQRERERESAAVAVSPRVSGICL